MEEIVYQFLLQTAGYPRASIVSDTTVLFPDEDDRPDYVIVDPDEAEPLAVIHVVGAVDAAGLYAESSLAFRNQKALKPASVQGFVVRLDFKGKTDREKVQFYRAKEKGELYPLTASNFPDLGSLRVAAKLNSPRGPADGGHNGRHDSGRNSSHNSGHNRGDYSGLSSTHNNVHVLPIAHSNNVKPAPRMSAEEFASLPEEEREILEAREDFVRPVEEADAGRRGRTHIWLGLLLILLAVGDAAGSRLLGQPLLELTHVLLIVGAVFLFVLG